MHSEQKKAYMAMSPEQKLKVSLSLYHSAQQLKASALEREHPDWSKERIRQEVRKIFLYART